MKNYEKGSYGYIKHYKRSRLIATIILLLMIIFIVVTMIIMFGDTKRVGIVFAILLTLPFAKLLIAYIMCATFNSMEKSDYDRLTKESASSSCILLFDVVITQYEGMKFYPSMCIKNGKIYAYLGDRQHKGDTKDYEKWIEKAMEDSKYKYKIAVFTELDAYLHKINSTVEPNDTNKVIDKHIAERLLEFGV